METNLQTELAVASSSPALLQDEPTGRSPSISTISTLMYVLMPLRIRGGCGVDNACSVRYPVSSTVYTLLKTRLTISAGELVHYYA
jgi:hypothetical protein